MTRAQISTLILSWLDDPNQGYFTASALNTWINLAQRQVQMELLQAGQNWYQTIVETMTVPNQADYVLPSDFMVLHRLEAVISGTGPQENTQDIQQMTTNQKNLTSVVAGQPTNYVIKKDRFTLYPTPQLAQVLRLYYSPIVADLTADADVPNVPEQFMEYVAILAAFDGFVKDDRAPDNLVIKKAKYEDLLKRMATDRGQEKSREVVTVNEYDVGSWF